MCVNHLPIVLINFYHSLDKFSRQQIDDILCYFSQKTGSDISCICAIWSGHTAFLSRGYRMPRSACALAQADLGLRYPPMPWRIYTYIYNLFFCFFVVVSWHVRFMTSSLRNDIYNVWYYWNYKRNNSHKIYVIIISSKNLVWRIKLIRRHKVMIYA